MPKSYSFGDFTIDLDRGCLVRAGEEVRLRPKVYEALKYLIENNNRLVSKEELIRAIWPASFVTDDSLVQCLVEVRRALGDEAQRCIKTVPRRGYMFVAEVNPVSLARFDETRAGEGATATPVGAEVAGDFAQPQQPAVEPPALIVRKTNYTALALVITILVFVNVGLYFFFRDQRPQDDAIHSIAVMPLVNASGDPNLDYLSDGITENIINSLSRLPNLKVMARATVFRYKGQEADPIKVGHELKVGAMLTGSVVQQGENLTVNVDLVNVADGSQLWGEKYDRKLSGIFTLQEEIAQQISDKLRLRLTGEEQKRLSKRYTDNAAAYQLYLRGRYYLGKYTEEGSKKGLESFRQAIDLDPNYALAYAGMADAYYGLSNLYLPANEAMPKAKAIAMKALELDETLAEGHASLAVVKSQYEWDWEAAEREYKRALELNPGVASVHYGYSIYLLSQARPKEALAELKRAQELDPLSLTLSLFAVFPFYYAPPPLRQYDRAIEELRKMIETEKDFSSAHSLLGGIYVQKGMYEEAVSEHKKAWELGNNLWDLAYLVRSYARAGKKNEARKALDELQERAKREHVAPNWMAVAYVGLGEKDQALAWLEKAYEERDENMTLLDVDPVFDSLRTEPRFAALLRRMGFAPWS